MFLADEVGQFIGNDTHLMLNLQTITEQLGTVCRRARLGGGDLAGGPGRRARGSEERQAARLLQDPGRFKTRLSLSSANVDEVIKKRLLERSRRRRAAGRGLRRQARHPARTSSRS